MALQAAVRPDWLELLCDADTPPEASKKRQRKALDRSLELLDECLSLKDDHQVIKYMLQRVWLLQFSSVVSKFYVFSASLSFKSIL